VEFVGELAGSASEAWVCCDSLDGLPSVTDLNDLGGLVAQEPLRPGAGLDGLCDVLDCDLALLDGVGFELGLEQPDGDLVALPESVGRVAAVGSRVRSAVALVGFPSGTTWPASPAASPTFVSVADSVALSHRRIVASVTPFSLAACA